MRNQVETRLSFVNQRLRRSLIAAILAVPLVAAAQSGPSIEVWKTPECGCCKDWVEHLRANGFGVIVNDVSDTSDVRRKLSMPEQFGSCHSGRVSGYALEGHIPAAEIRRLLRERPSAAGLSVPGMPLGAPGMDGPAYQGRSRPYDVLLVGKEGKAAIYQAYK